MVSFSSFKIFLHHFVDLEFLLLFKMLLWFGFLLFQMHQFYGKPTSEELFFLLVIYNTVSFSFCKGETWLSITVDYFVFSRTSCKWNLREYNFCVRPLYSACFWDWVLLCVLIDHSFLLLNNVLLYGNTTKNNYQYTLNFTNKAFPYIFVLCKHLCDILIVQSLKYLLPRPLKKKFADFKLAEQLWVESMLEIQNNKQHPITIESEIGFYQNP